MQPIGVCVIGAGDLGRKHAECWQQVEGAELAATVDIQEDRAKAAYADFGFPAWFTDYREGLQQPGVDVVSVCVPNYLHSEMSVAAMDLGYHVFCEKPIATTIDGAKAMIAARERNGVKFGVALCKRFWEPGRKIAQLVNDRTIGRPTMYRVVSGIEIRYKSWIHDKVMSGGPLVDIGPHYFDQWRQLFKSEPTTVMAMGQTFSAGAAELAGIDSEIDTATIIVQFASGDIGMLSLSWGLPRGTSTSSVEHIMGPDGVIELIEGERVVLRTREEEETVLERAENDMYVDEIAAFAAAIREDKPPFASGEDGLAALRVSLAALESVKTGQVVKLNS